MWDWKRADLRRARLRVAPGVVGRAGRAVWPAPLMAILAIWTIICAIWPDGRAWAALELTPHFGFNDTLAAGDWTPARITVANDIDPAKPEAELRDFSGSLRLTATDYQGRSIRYEQALELPQKTRKVVEFPVMMGIGAVQAQLVNTRGAVVLTKQLGPLMNPGANQRLDPDMSVRPTVVIAQESEETVRTPPGVAAWVNAEKIPYEELPSDARSYQSVRALVISRRLSARLTPEQLDALDQWIRCGGTLIVMTPRRASEIRLDTWLAERLPATVEDSAETSAAALDPAAGADPVMLTRWGARAEGAQVVWDSESGPLALERRLGLGRVVAFGVDPSDLPASLAGQRFALDATALIESLILTPREDLRARHQFSTQDLDPNFSGVSLLPKMSVVIVFLASFMVIVGPLNFYILRRRNRLELAWVTIPALSILFFLAIYAYGKTLRTERQLQASAEILHLASGERDGFLLWNTIQFSPAAEKYTFTTARPGAIQPVMTFYQPNLSMWQQMGFRGGLPVPENSAAVVRQEIGGSEAGGAPFTLENRVPYGVMAFYMGESPRQIEGGITVQPVMSGDGSIQLTVRNASKTALTDVKLAVGQLEYPVADRIEPGASLETQLPPAANSAQTNVQNVNQYNPQLNYNRFGMPMIQTTPLPPGASFEQMATDLIRRGANQGYPIQLPFRTQSRVRLSARQEGWRSEVKVEPEPSLHKTAGMVEIEAELALQEEVRFGSNTSPAVSAFRRDVYAYEPDKVRFNDPNSQGTLGWVSDGSLEVLFAPPPLVGPVRFVSGQLQVTLMESGEQAELEIYDFQSAQWFPVDLKRPIAQRGQQNQTVLSTIEIVPDNVNPHGQYVRLRLRSKTGGSQGGGGAFQGWGGYRGTQFQALEGGLTFAPGHSE